MRAEVSLFEAFITQGRQGVSACQFDPLVERPQFRLWCQMAADDQTAWFQLLAAPPRSMLGVPVIQGMARRDPGQPITLLLASPGAGMASTGSAPVGDGATFRSRVVSPLNPVRAQAGLPAVRREAAQSDAAERLAPQYFTAPLQHPNQPTNTPPLP